MQQTFDEQTTFVVIICASCGIPFGVEFNHYKRLRKNGATFYCPSGHGQWFGQSESDKLRQQLKEEKKNSAYWRDQAIDTRNSLTATRGVVTKLKNTISSGVCPCCHQTFKILKKHMEKMHPDFEYARDESISQEDVSDQ